MWGQLLLVLLLWWVNMSRCFLGKLSLAGWSIGPPASVSAWMEITPALSADKTRRRENPGADVEVQWCLLEKLSDLPGGKL